MKSIGIRDLRQRASVVLRQVEKGVTFEVTDRGRPVALLGPMPDATAIERLRAEGDVSIPSGTLDELRAPPRIAAGATPPSLVLARLRADER